MKDHHRGKILAALGLPGVGKSSVMGALAKLLGAHVFLEPEEHEWGQAIRAWDRIGHFTGLMWFRAARVPLIYEAHRLRAGGEIALLDSYYDKVLHCYLGHPGMEWLLAPEDPYFAVASEVAKLDWIHLPDADCVIAFDIDFEDWHALLSRRNRVLDRDEGFRRSYETQRYFIEAAERLATERGIQLVRFRQSFGTVEDAALRLLAALRSQNILP